jgi:hypothetical protein
MNYLEIVTQGFFNDNTRNQLENYFYRKYKKAEKEQFFEPDEFFRGCLRVIEKWKKDFEKEAFNYLRELIFTIDGIKAGTIPVNAMEGKTIKESKQWLIEYYERESKNFQENGIQGVLNEQITKTLYSNNRLISYNLTYFELLQIELSIQMAFMKTKTNIEPLPPQQEKQKSKGGRPKAEYKPIETFINENPTYKTPKEIANILKSQYLGENSTNLKTMVEALKILNIWKNAGYKKIHLMLQQDFGLTTGYENYRSCKEPEKKHIDKEKISIQRKITKT